LSEAEIDFQTTPRGKDEEDRKEQTLLKSINNNNTSSNVPSSFLAELPMVTPFPSTLPATVPEPSNSTSTTSPLKYSSSPSLTSSASSPPDAFSLVVARDSEKIGMCGHPFALLQFFFVLFSPSFPQRLN
jgi:hypothetical protein